MKRQDIKLLTNSSHVSKNGCILLLHLYDKYLTGSQDACVTEIDQFS